MARQVIGGVAVMLVGNGEVIGEVAGRKALEFKRVASKAMPVTIGKNRARKEIRSRDFCWFLGSF